MRYQRQVHLGVAPRAAKLVGRHGHRREARRGLALEKSESLGELGWNQVAKRNVVDQHEKANMRSGCCGSHAERHVAGDHRHFGLEVDSPCIVRKRDVVAGADEAVGTALIHQRIGPELGRHGRAARLANQLDMIHVRRCIGPLVSPRKGRVRHSRIEALRARKIAVIEPCADLGQSR